MSLVHVNLRITDIERSLDFYEALGFEEKRRFPNGDVSVHVFIGQPVDGDEPPLELAYEYNRSSSQKPQTDFGHIAIVTPDLDESLSQLAAHGYQPEGEPTYWPQAGTKVCFVRDPDGYPVELIQRGVTAP